MKKILTVLVLGSVAFVSADQYSQSYGNRAGSCPTCNSGGGYYQGQPNNDHYYQQNQRQNPQGYYYQRDDRNYQRNHQYDNQQQSPRNQSHDQNQQYYQQHSNDNQTSYNRGSQTNYDNTSRSQNGENQRTSSDQEINKKIQETLSSGWFSNGFKNVSFNVNNGNVNLRGSVDTLENKNDIEDSVKKIDGVKQINNQITILKENAETYSDSELEKSEKKYPQDFASNLQDRQLNAKIRDKLNNGWISNGYETLVIRTTNGIVIISGNVDNSDDAKEINDQLKKVEGVRSVNNRLSVKNK